MADQGDNLGEGNSWYAKTEICTTRTARLRKLNVYTGDKQKAIAFSKRESNWKTPAAKSYLVSNKPAGVLKKFKES